MTNPLETLLYHVVAAAASELPLLARELDSISFNENDPLSFECARLRRDLLDLENRFVTVASELSKPPSPVSGWRKPAYGRSPSVGPRHRSTV